MNVLDFLATLRERDIQIFAEGLQLHCNAPAGALTAELRDELRQRKHEILNFLRSAESLVGQQPGIVPLQSQGTAAPIFAVAGHNGDVFCFRALAQHLGEDQPFFGLQPPGLDGNREPLSRVEDLAAFFAAQIRTFRPNGSCVIVGYCAGGTIAFELARQLLRDGVEVCSLALFGSPFPTNYQFFPKLRLHFEQLAKRIAKHIRALASLPMTERRNYVAERICNLRIERDAQRRAAGDPALVLRDKVGRATLSAIRRYQPNFFCGRLNLFWPCKNAGGDALAQWPMIARDTEKYFGPDGCDGTKMLREPYAATFAKLLKKSLQITSDGKICSPQKSPDAAPSWQTGQMQAMSF